MKVFVAANDAGGAEVLSEYLLSKKINFSGIFTGPAKIIFSEKFGPSILKADETELMSCGELIVATSSISTTELRQIQTARKNGITSIAIIDGVGNFKMRFERDGLICLPDKFIVETLEAKRDLELVFGKQKVIIEENYYLKKFKKLKNSSEDIVLYLTDPISDHGSKYFGDSNYFGFDEFEALELFLVNYDKVMNEAFKIVIRPHPDESVCKYRYLQDKFRHLDIDIDQKDSLENHVNSAKVVIGCSNNAMLAALAAGKRVVSILPTRIQSFGMHDGKFEVIKL